MSGNGGDGGSGGQSLSGGPAEPLPEGWGAPAAPRVGRVGQTTAGGGSGRCLSTTDLARLRC